MKRLIVILFISFNLSNAALADNDFLADKISDEVVDALIETHMSFINSNVLSEICGNSHYLAINYHSSEIKNQILKDIAFTAKYRGVKKYNAQSLLEEVQLIFRQFVEGTTYGASVSKNFISVNGQSYCNEEVAKSIHDSQKKLAEKQGYRLEKRKVKIKEAESN